MIGDTTVAAAGARVALLHPGATEKDPPMESSSFSASRRVSRAKRTCYITAAFVLMCLILSFSLFVMAKAGQMPAGREMRQPEEERTHPSPISGEHGRQVVH